MLLWWCVFLYHYFAFHILLVFLSIQKRSFEINKKHFHHKKIHYFRIRFLFYFSHDKTNAVWYVYDKKSQEERQRKNKKKPRHQYNIVCECVSDSVNNYFKNIVLLLYQPLSYRRRLYHFNDAALSTCTHCHHTEMRPVNSAYSCLCDIACLGLVYIIFFSRICFSVSGCCGKTFGFLAFHYSHIFFCIHGNKLETRLNWIPCNSRCWTTYFICIFKYIYSVWSWLCVCMRARLDILSICGALSWLHSWLMVWLCHFKKNTRNMKPVRQRTPNTHTQASTYTSCDLSVFTCVLSTRMHRIHTNTTTYHKKLLFRLM